MLTENSDVKRGLANGTKATVQQVKLLDNQHPFHLQLSNGIFVPAVYASQVHSVVLQHTNTDIRPQQFHMQPRSHTFTAAIPNSNDVALFCGNEKSHVRMRGEQLPFILNMATTGHKLQGATMQSLFVNDYRFEQNWVYVVLSRVTTMAGLYLRNPLPEDLSLYQSSTDLEKLLGRLADAGKRVTELDKDDYDTLIRGDPHNTA